MERVNPLAQGHIVADVYLARKSENIRNLFLGLFIRISAADRPSLVVNAQHLRLCFRPSHAKETFQHKTTNSIGVWSSFSSTTSQRWRFINVSTPCPQFDSKEMTMTPTEWLILTITTFVVVIAAGVWFYRLTH